MEFPRALELITELVTLLGWPGFGVGQITVTQRITRHSQGSMAQRLLLICSLDTALIQVTGEFSSMHMDLSISF